MAASSISTSSLSLPESVAGEVIGRATELSAVMQLAQPIALPGNGLDIPVVTGDPDAAWVAETDEKPVALHTLATKVMKPYTLAVIEPFSNQFRDNYAALFGELVNRLPAALARKFDSTVFFGEAPGSGFDTLKEAKGVDISAKTYDGLVDCVTEVSAWGDLSGWALSPACRSILLKAKDVNGRPIFIQDASAQGTVSSVLGVPAVFSRAAYDENTKAVGFGGDWTAARYGIVNSIDIQLSDQATLTTSGGTLNLWQRNMFAVRAEIEVGFVIADKSAFVRLTNGAGVVGK